MESAQLEMYRSFIRQGKAYNDALTRLNKSIYNIAEYTAGTKCEAAVAVAEIAQGVDSILSVTYSIFSANTQYLIWNIDVFNQMARDVYIAQEQPPDNSNPLIISCNFGSLPENAAYFPNLTVYKVLEETLKSMKSIYVEGSEAAATYNSSYRQTRDYVSANIVEYMDHFFSSLQSYFNDESFNGGLSFTGAMKAVYALLDGWMQKILNILQIRGEI